MVDLKADAIDASQKDTRLLHRLLEGFLPNLFHGSNALAFAPARHGDLGSHLRQLTGSYIPKASVGAGHYKVLTRQVLGVGEGKGERSEWIHDNS